MEAVICEGAGTRELSECFSLGSAPKPSADAGEVLIKVVSVSLNPVDWKKAKFNFGIDAGVTVLGCDSAGVVAAVGEGVTDCKVGDNVWCMANAGKAKRGCFGAFIAVPSFYALPLPGLWGFEESCTLGVTQCTAAQALFHPDHLALSTKAEGKPLVLVWGGTSGVGHFAVQHAAAAGYEVIATASYGRLGEVIELGAAHAVDYRAKDAVAQIVAAAAGRPIVAAFDCISADSALKCARALAGANKDSGTTAKVQCIAGVPDAEVPDGVTCFGMYCGNGEDDAVMHWLADFCRTTTAELIAAGKLRAQAMTRSFGRKSIPEAIETLFKGAHGGKKLVVTVDSCLEDAFPVGAEAPLPVSVEYPSGLRANNLTHTVGWTPTGTHDAPTRVTCDETSADKLYTLAVVDPDAISRTNPAFRGFCHWVVVNAKGGDSLNFAAEGCGETAVPYLAPGPPRNSRPHRYIFCVYEQAGTVSKEAAEKALGGRGGTNTHEFLVANGCKAGPPMAAGLFEAEWDPMVDVHHTGMGFAPPVPYRSQAQALAASRAEWAAEEGVVPDSVPAASITDATNAVGVTYAAAAAQAPAGAPMHQWTVSDTQDKPKVNCAGTSADKLYTLAVVDPDAISRANPVFRSFVHWIVCNTKGGEGVDFGAGGDTAVDYLSPGPPYNSGAHRYVFCIYEQTGPVDVEACAKAMDGRGGKDAHAYLTANGCSATLVGVGGFKAAWERIVDDTHAGMGFAPPGMYRSPSQVAAAAAAGGDEGGKAEESKHGPDEGEVKAADVDIGARVDSARASFSEPKGHSGTVQKRGHTFKTWKERHLVLDAAGTLTWYDDKDHGKVHGHVSLDNTSTVEAVKSTHKGVHCFQVNGVDNYLLAHGKDDDDTAMWVGAIQTFIDAAAAQAAKK